MGKFSCAGNCVTLFALLTPLGSVQLLNSRRLDASPRIRAPVAQLLDARFTHTLESGIALAGDMSARLHCFAAWLEERAKARGRQDRAALRAARAAMRLCHDSQAAVETVAGLMQMKHGKLHPSINIETLDAAIDLDVRANVAVDHQIEIMLKNSFGFGGLNCCALFRRFH